jgi:hypothetical protein
MKKERSLIMAAVGAVLFFASIQPAQADVTNGEFISNLDIPWMVAPNNSVLWSDDDGDNDGAAQFVQGASDNQYLDSTLSQEFPLDPLSMTLSFYVRMNLEGNGLPPETDIFTAKLAGTTFYTLSSDSFFDSENNLLFDEFEETVTYDVSGLQSQRVNLVFNLNHVYGDGWIASVHLDEVDISLVPVPGAFVLGSLGLGVAGWRLRRRRPL